MTERRPDHAFDALAHWLEHPQRFPADFISIPLDLVPRVLTTQRTRLLAYLEEHGPVDSVEALAAALGRNYASVSRDVGYLLGGRFVAAEQHGHCKRLRAAGLPILITPASKGPWLTSAPG